MIPRALGAGPGPFICSPVHHVQVFCAAFCLRVPTPPPLIVQCSLSMVSYPCSPTPGSLQSFFLPESLQPNLTLGSQTWVTPSQLFSSLESMQSVSPSQRHRRGMHRPSSRHWNSSLWQPPGGLVAAGRQVEGMEGQVSHSHLCPPNLSPAMPSPGPWAQAGVGSSPRPLADPTWKHQF